MIEGVQVITMETERDDRGQLIEIERVAGDPEPQSLVHTFGQVDLVGNPARGSIRRFRNTPDCGTDSPSLTAARSSSSEMIVTAARRMVS